MPPIPVTPVTPAGRIPTTAWLPSSVGPARAACSRWSSSARPTKAGLRANGTYQGPCGAGAAPAAGGGSPRLCGRRNQLGAAGILRQGGGDQFRQPPLPVRPLHQVEHHGAKVLAAGHVDQPHVQPGMDQPRQGIRRIGRTEGVADTVKLLSRE